MNYRRGVILALFLILLAPQAANADGKAFGGKFPHFKTLHEKEQVAVIAHQDGIQKMMLAVNIAMASDESGLWILPIPAAATDVEIDLLDSFPRFQGDDPRHVDIDYHTAFLLMRIPQVWPLFFDAIFSPNFLGVDLQIHAKAQKWGIHSEVIETESKEALLSHIHSEGIELASKELDSFDPYFNGDFSFVATWIESISMLKEKFPESTRSLHEGRWPSLMVTFPTKRAFYPMLASRWEPEEKDHYGSLEIQLAVVGHVTPVVIESSTTDYSTSFQHQIQSEWPKGCPEAFIEGLPTQDIRFSAAWIFVYPEYIDSDIWFEPYHPPGMDLAIRMWKLVNWLVHPVSLVLFYGLFSCLCAAITGWTLFGRSRRMALTGLWNFTTIVGLGFALKFQGLPDDIAKKFLLRFTLIFVFGTYLIQLGLWWLIETLAGVGA
ncbi:MAG: hypothetical protein KC940_01500 [Candidatus Omnitrophica bacterium]|nr:hypothetical protein [Candidatus Omnitrophota bacterium]